MVGKEARMVDKRREIGLCLDRNQCGAKRTFVAGRNFRRVYRVTGWCQRSMMGIVPVTMLMLVDARKLEDRRYADYQVD